VHLYLNHPQPGRPNDSWLGASLPRPPAPGPTGSCSLRGENHATATDELAQKCT